MSLVTRAGDLVYTFRFLKLLTTKFEDTDAFKLGIVDKDGKRIKSKVIARQEERSAYTTFHRLVFNIKRLLAQAPGGSSRLASYAAALFLLRENFNVSDDNLKKILNKCGIDPLDLLEEEHQWFMMQDNVLSPGIYKLKNEKLLSETLDPWVNKNDKLRVQENCSPVGEIFGVNIYEGLHVNTNRNVYFTVGEIYK